MPLPFTTSSPFFTAFIVLCAAPVISSPLPIPPTCRSNLTIIWHLILFYAANYIAHAAAVPVPLSARHIRVRIGRLKFILPLHGVLALVLPLSGILASLHLALRSLDYDEVALAWYTQALGVVTRTDDWTPPEGREERVPVRLPDTFDSTQDDDVPQASAKCVVGPDKSGIRTKVFDTRRYTTSLAAFVYPLGISSSESVIPMIPPRSRTSCAPTSMHLTRRSCIDPAAG